MTDNHYEILGVAKDADGDAIKRAYRTKARILHPDAGGSAGAFAKLNLAYDTLSDTDRRAHYNATGNSELPTNPSEIRARVLIDDIFRKYLDRPDGSGRYTYDLVNAIRHDLDEGERLIPAMVAECQNKIAMLEKLIERLNGGIMIGTVSQTIRQLEARIIFFENERPAIEAARELLKRCRHTPERDLATTYMPPRRQTW